MIAHQDQNYGKGFYQSHPRKSPEVSTENLAALNKLPFRPNFDPNSDYLTNPLNAKYGGSFTSGGVQIKKIKQERIAIKPFLREDPLAVIPNSLDEDL
jgi:hypothetical protein